MRKTILGVVSICLLLGLTGCSSGGAGANVVSDETDADYDATSAGAELQTEDSSSTQTEIGEESSVQTDTSKTYTVDTKISDVINDPVFGDYGRLIFPVDTGFYGGETLGELRLTWYNNISPDKTVEITNYMRDHAEAGDVIFYNIYTDEEKKSDPEKGDTGLFFFKGNPGEKFAVCNAGGGFAYVGAMQDSFPHALELSKKGYNAFALIYRPGAQTACEDLARAISFIFAHAEELEVDTECYSLWGGSAGARMAAWLGSYGTEAFGEERLPQAGAVIMQYTGLSDYTETDPPTYVCVGENDGIANWRTMQSRLDAMSKVGIDTEFHKYPGLGHGFGIGTGTVAEGWIDDAVAFWEKQAKGYEGMHGQISGYVPAYYKEMGHEEMTSSEQGGAIDMEQGEDIARIPAAPLQIPDDYYSQASEQGTLERLEYTTYESFSYEERTKQLTKTAYVYLPYDYSADKQYNVFYLMHGGWANETTYLGTPENTNVFKNVVDHAVQDGKMESVIIVCPTYNNENPDDSDDYGLALRLTDNYHNELLNDLIPAVEGKYSTYAEGTSLEELERSREHRAFCGFSMGSVTTWHTFEYCLPYFRYFLPSSGDLTSDGQYMESIVTGSGYGPEDFFIYAMSGTRDFDYSAFSRMIQAMLDAPGGIFIEADNEKDGNLAYRVQEGNEHNGEAAMQYIYNGLVWLWKGEK